MLGIGIVVISCRSTASRFLAKRIANGSAIMTKVSNRVDLIVCLMFFAFQQSTHAEFSDSGPRHVAFGMNKTTIFRTDYMHGTTLNICLHSF